MTIELCPHDRLNIASTIVLLKAMCREKGEMPLAVQLGGEAGWERVAIQYLDEMEGRKQRGLPLRKAKPQDESKWAETNERWDYEERKQNDGKLIRELAAQA